MRHLVHLLVVLFVVAAAPATGQKTPGYVGSDACTGCHTGAAEAWAGSHHALAWTEASPETVVADFDGTQFALDGMTAQFRTDGETYDVEVTETDGTTTDYPVHSVAGIEPLQQYLLETEPGRLQSFDVVWDTEREEWYHLYPDQDLPPDDALHWTGPYKTWNARCAECHATGYDKNYDATTQTYASTEVEIGVGCEACHGPGSEHVAWAEIADSGADLGAYGFTVDFDDTEAAIQQCAGCHSRREPYGDGNPIPGTPYHDAYNLSLLRPGLYHADGQILDEVYVYGSFLQSKMFEAGVGCTDCHEPHTAELVTEGNAVCTQCHSPAGREEFPAAAGEYDTPAHHFHEEGSEAAQCVSCHMTDRAYMGVDWRRDHSFRIPRPDLAATTGAPDACTTCHEDREPDWQRGSPSGSRTPCIAGRITERPSRAVERMRSPPPANSRISLPTRANPASCARRPSGFWNRRTAPRPPSGWRRSFRTTTHWSGPPPRASSGPRPQWSGCRASPGCSTTLRAASASPRHVNSSTRRSPACRTRSRQTSPPP